MIFPPEETYERAHRVRSWPLPRPPPISEIVRDPRNAPPKPRRHQYSPEIPAVSTQSGRLIEQPRINSLSNVTEDVVDSSGSICSAEFLRPPEIKIRAPVTRTQPIRRRSKSVMTTSPREIETAPVCHLDENRQKKPATPSSSDTAEYITSQNSDGNNSSSRTYFELDRQWHHFTTTCLESESMPSICDSLPCTPGTPPRSTLETKRSRNLPLPILCTREVNFTKKRGSIRKFLSKLNIAQKERDTSTKVPTASAAFGTVPESNNHSLSIGDPVLTSDTRGKDIDWVQFFQELNRGSSYASVHSDVVTDSKERSTMLLFRRIDSVKRDNGRTIDASAKTLDRCERSLLGNLFMKMSQLKQ